MLKLKNKTAELNLIDKTNWLLMKNETTELNLIDDIVLLSMKNETVELNFNLKVYTQEHLEFFVVLEFMNANGGLI